MVRSAVLLALLTFVPRQDDAGERARYVEKNLDAGLARALKALRGLQHETGRFDWSRTAESGDYRAVYGPTALALYAFLAAGESLDDSAPRRALDWLLENPVTESPSKRFQTYDTALVAVALSYSIPQMREGARRNRAVAMLQDAANLLVNTQARHGGWSYGNSFMSGGMSTAHDHSNSQFGILGLRAAANAGAKVPDEVWERELRHYALGQTRDGGWGYSTCFFARSSTRGSTSTMTAAGAMGLAIALGSANPKNKAYYEGLLKQGLEALKTHWKRGLDRPLKSLSSLQYLLYSVERACMVSGQLKLDDIDWYVEGAAVLLKRQNPEGLWETGPDAAVTQSFAILFLKRAFVPVQTPSNAVGGAGKSESSGDKPKEME